MRHAGSMGLAWLSCVALSGAAFAETDLADWTRHVRVGGSANTGYYRGELDSVFHDTGFEVWDARFFVDAELGEELSRGSSVLVRNAGFSFEWNLARLGKEQNHVGELYAELQGIADSGWLNAALGRFQIPVGESYLRYSKGYRENPFVTNAVGGPWFWDEGLKLYGGAPNGRFQYVASVSDGENDFHTDQDPDPQLTLKLIVQAASWLRLSLSGLHTGTLGDDATAGEGAFWVGESWARAFGSGTSVPSFVDGVAVPDGPNRIDETWWVGADAVVSLGDWARLWGAYGRWTIDQDDPLYDRRLHAWIAEVLLYGEPWSEALADVYLGLRASGLGTYDDDEGYLLDFRYGGGLGYNMKSLTAYSVVLGWKLFRFVTLRAEYTHTDIDLVDGVPRALSSAAREADSWGLEVGVQF